MPNDPIIEVIKPGLATSVQDTGRQGYYHLGIPPSGALDQYALAAANLLVGNAADAAVYACAANDDGCDGVELKALACHRLAGIEAGSKDDACDRRHEAAQHINADLRALDRDTGQTRDL